MTKEEVEVSDLVNVSVRLPSDEFIELSVPPEIEISGIIAALARHCNGLKGNKILLLHRQKKMSPEQPLTVYNVDNNKSINIEAVVSCLDDMDLRYDDFIERVTLSTTSQSMKHVSISTYFTIR
jgi:hypothetical protein